MLNVELNERNHSRYSMVEEVGGIIKNVDDHFPRMQHLQGLILLSCFRLEMYMKSSASSSRQE
jgi:hypothetical protein